MLTESSGVWGHLIILAGGVSIVNLTACELLLWMHIILPRVFYCLEFYILALGDSMPNVIIKLGAKPCLAIDILYIHTYWVPHQHFYSALHVGCQLLSALVNQPMISSWSFQAFKYVIWLFFMWCHQWKKYCLTTVLQFTVYWYNSCTITRQCKCPPGYSPSKLVRF